MSKLATQEIFLTANASSQNTPPEVQATFAGNRLYCGGFTAQHVIHLLHGHRLPGAVEVVPGVFMGGELAAAKEVGAWVVHCLPFPMPRRVMVMLQVAEGRLSANEFKFFAGAEVWPAGELQMEASQHAWYPAACSRSLVLKQCLQLSTPLWVEVLQLLGGEYSDAVEEAERGFDSDEPQF